MAPKPIDVVVRGRNESQGTFADVTRSAEELEKKVTALNKPFEALKSLVSTVGATVLVEFFRKTVEAAVEAEAAWARIGAAVSNAGIHISGVHGRLEELFTSMSKTSRFSERELADAFGTLMTVTHDYTASVDNMQLVANVAAAKQISLGEAATMVGRVIEGTGTRALKQWGISADNATEALEKLREVSLGYAERDAETLGGALHKIANAFEKIQEAIGKAITNGSGGGLKGFAENLNKIAEFIESHQSSWDRIERILSMTTRVAYAGPRLIGRLISPLLPADRESETDFGAAMMSGGQSLLADREIAANAAKALAERQAEALKKEVEELKKKIADTEGGVMEDADVRLAIERMKKQGFDPTSGSGELGVRNTLLQMRQRAELDRASMAFLNAGGPKATDLTTDPRTSAHPAQTLAEATKSVTGFGRGVRETFGDGSQYLQDFDERLGKMAGESIPTLAAGFEQMFEAIGKGANVFQALGKGVAQMIAQIAAKMSAEEFAQGLAMVARSIWDFLGPNPAAGASATQHFAAAAAFGVLAGGASALGGGSGSGSGGNGGALGTGSFLNQQSSLAASSLGPITVYVPRTGAVLDPNNKDSVDAWLDFFQQLQATRQVNFVFE